MCKVIAGSEFCIVKILHESTLILVKESLVKKKKFSSCSLILIALCIEGSCPDLMNRNEQPDSRPLAMALTPQLPPRTHRPLCLSVSSDSNGRFKALETQEWKNNLKAQVGGSTFKSAACNSLQKRMSSLNPFLNDVTFFVRWSRPIVPEQPAAQVPWKERLSFALLAPPPPPALASLVRWSTSPRASPLVAFHSSPLLGIAALSLTLTHLPAPDPRKCATTVAEQFPAVPRQAQRLQNPSRASLNTSSTPIRSYPRLQTTFTWAT